MFLAEDTDRKSIIYITRSPNASQLSKRPAIE